MDGGRNPAPVAQPVSDRGPAEVVSGQLEARADQVYGVVGEHRDEEVGADPMAFVYRPLPVEEIVCSDLTACDWVRFLRPGPGFWRWVNSTDYGLHGFAWIVPVGELLQWTPELR